jgi:hypothetical protein
LVFAAVLGAGLGVGGVGEARGFAAAGDGDGVGRLGAVGFDAGVLLDLDGVELVVGAGHADDALAVGEREEALHGLAVAGGGADVVDAQDVGRAELGVEGDRLAGVGAQHPADRVAVGHADGFDLAEALLALEAALARGDDPGHLADDVVLGRKVDLDAGADDGAAAVVAVGALDFEQFAAHDGPAGFDVAELGFDAGGFLAFVVELLAHEQDLELGEAVELELEDGLGLFFVEVVAVHHLAGGVGFAFAGADEGDDLVEGVEDGFEAFEAVDGFFELGEAVAEAAGDDFEAEVQELAEHVAQADSGGGLDLGVVGGDEAGQVDVEVLL